MHEFHQEESIVKKLAIVITGLLLTTSAWGATNDPGVNETRSRRGELVYKVVMKWGAYVQEAYKADVHDWARQMGPLFAGAPLDDLQQAADAKTFQAMNDVLLGKQASAAEATPGLIGSPDLDLTYVPVPPCRVLDTRLAGGAIVANTTRNFDISVIGDYSGQGGAASDCGGVGSVGSFAAAVINFTTVTPATGGRITAFPFATVRPLAATLNYAGGDIKGNEVIVKLDQGGDADELSVYATSTTHLVGDIVGYFMMPEATALDCVDVSASDTFAANTNAISPSAFCPAGRTLTGMRCTNSSWDARLVSIWDNWCTVRTGATSSTVTATARCCRTPGR